MGDSLVSGFVAVAGRPNVGKSTLMNALVGHKVAIVSDKPQTTRNQIQCVLNGPNSQVVLIDTPGVHAPRHRLGEYMVKAAYAAWQGVDCVLFVVDGSAGTGAGDRYVAERLRNVTAPVILVVNKTDLMDRDRTLLSLAVANELGDFHAVFPVSAMMGDNVAELRQEIISLMPQGPKYFPDGVLSDHPEEFVVAEFVREQVLQHTREEVPHSVAVSVEELRPEPDRDTVHIMATIHVERESQKGILIGRRGSMLKRVGTEARREIEAVLGSRVYLDLNVKVSENWRDRPAVLKRLGYENES